MRQAWIRRLGGPEVLEIREAADPEPRDGEVRIRVAAAGVNFADVLIRIGIYPDAPPLPAVIGYEVSGIVDRVGPGVEDFGEGTRVAAFTPNYGGYSDTVVVPAGEVVRIPDDVDLHKAAAVPVNYVTAWLMLIHAASLQPGERVLIHSVAGGVGQAALQICRWRGARVIGTASQGKHESLRGLGVESCIDSSLAAFAPEVMRLTDGQGVDIALDGVGGGSFAQSYRCLAPLGRLCVFGVSAMVPGARRSLAAVAKGWLAMPRFNPLSLLQDNKAVLGFSMGRLRHKAGLRIAALKEILLLVGNGTFEPVIDSTFPLERAGEAHERLQSRGTFGKVLLST